ncbi:MAG: methyltransferase domain-containing protein [Caldilineae bacterium]|nr:MAG: methyltransferase domain-containing protein [Caldilineae bacterium]
MTTTADTRHTRQRYNLIAPLYDLMEGWVELLWYGRWRRRLWREVIGPRVLELGVGTGKNFSHHPDHIDITGIDISPGMLARAHKRAQRLQRRIPLLLMDAQHLEWPDNEFDEVVATFVFCSVPDPVQGLREAYRVTKPGGRLLLLEHMLAKPRALARLMSWLDKPIHWLTGVHIARRTLDNVRAAGWEIESVTSLSPADIFRMIIARKPVAA